MLDFNSEQTQIVMVLMIAFGFVAGYALRAAISQARRLHSYSSRRQQQPQSAFRTQPVEISPSPQVPVSSSSAPDVLNEDNLFPVQKGVQEVAAK